MSPDCLREAAIDRTTGRVVHPWPRGAFGVRVGMRFADNQEQTMESERRLTSSSAGAAMLAAAGTSLRFPTHVAEGNNAKR